ncbi:MAG: amidohydrolase family protein [Sphaerochaetaceae bacterium]
MGRIYIENGFIVETNEIFKGNILISDGQIKRVERGASTASVVKNCTVIDATDLYVFPGFIDAHTHYGVGEGSNKSSDTFYSGSKAAAFGGITTVIDFSDQIREKSLLESSQMRIEEAKESFVDFALHQGIYFYHDKLEEEIKELVNFGIRVLKIFTTYKEAGLFLDLQYWQPLFELAKKYQLLVTVHAESQTVLEEIEKSLTNKMYPASMQNHLRPPLAEASAILEVGEIAKKYNLPLYIVHVSSKDALNALNNLSQFIPVCGETAPHYLTLTDSLLDSQNGNLYVVNPPLRKAEDNKRLLEALKNGELSVVATDHCSYSKEQKLREKECQKVLGGISGSETMASLLYSSAVVTNYITISEMRKLLCDNPAKAFGLYSQKGSLEPNSDGDIALFKIGIKEKIEINNLHGLCDYTPYENTQIDGKVITTIKGGKIIVQDGKLVADKPCGKFLKSNRSSVFDRVQL